jgi:hypothetical protein
MMDDTRTVEQRAAQLVRRIEEDATGAYAEFGRRILMHPTSIPYLQKCVLWYVGEYFDIHAKWYLSEISKYDQIQSHYGPLLVDFAAQAVKRSEEMRADWSVLARVGVQGTMQILLQARIHHWEAQAIKKIRKIEEEALNREPEPENRRSHPREIHPDAKPSVAKKARTILEPKPELLKDVESVTRLRAAAAIGVSPRTLDRYAERQLLTPIGPVGRKRFKTRDLIKFMNSKNNRQPRQQ